jgi:long-chain fatty acid transport protein
MRHVFSPRGLLGMGLLLATATPGYCLGYRVPNQGAQAVARGNAFVATADDPSAVYYNPAGITQLEGHQASFGSYNVHLNSEYRSPAGTDSETDFRIVPVPFGYYTYNPGKLPVAFGVGLNNPYGLQLGWPQDSGFRTYVTEAMLQYISLNPVIAWKATPELSLAMGPTINYSMVQLKSGIFPNNFASNDDEFSFDGNGWDFGFTAGLLWKPHKQWAFGFNYRSATSINYEGDLNLRTLSPLEYSEAEVKFPSTFAVGLSFRPTEKWNLEFDVDYTNWDEIEDVTFTRENAPGIVMPFDYKSGFMYKFGVSHSFDNGLTLSGGYFYTENNVKDVAFNPAVPDTPLHAFSLGGSYERKNWTYGLAYQYITGPWRTVHGSTPSAAGESADGDYKYEFHTVTASIAYKF